MWVLDRYIARRFLANFLILLGLLFVFAISIDLILQLDEFVEAAENRVGEEAGFLRKIWALAIIIVDYHGPRVFQFYAYMLGLLTVGSMGFTFSQMHRAKEFVAVLAAGVRLHRVAYPVVVVAFGLNLVQLANQELVLPRMAPLLIRSHDAIGKQSVGAFEVLFTADGAGNLLQSPAFSPATATLETPTILQRDDNGRALLRITADRATWDAEDGRWMLTNGRALRPRVESETGSLDVLAGRQVTEFETDLTPQVITMRRYRQYATMLSVAKIREMLNTPGVVNTDALERFLVGRFSTILINMLLLVMTLPYFLLREPTDMLRNSILCAGLSLPVMLGTLVGFTVDIPGISPAVAVFLPAMVLIPITMFMVGLIKT